MILRVRFDLKMPAHVGFGKRKQVRDPAGNPLVPWIVLATQIGTLARRLGGALGRSPGPFRVSDGFVGEPRWFKYKGTEYFIGRVTFGLAIEERDLELFGGALRLLENLGLGAETSRGFGYGRAQVELETTGHPPRPLELSPRIFAKLRSNWASWRAGMDRPFEGLAFHKATLEGRASPGAIRGLLRRAMLQVVGIDHGKVLTCPPNRNPCPVCQVMGSLGRKSKVIVRTFRSQGGTVAYVIADSLDRAEKDLLLSALEPLGFQEARILPPDSLLAEPEALTE